MRKSVKFSAPCTPSQSSLNDAYFSSFHYRLQIAITPGAAGGFAASVRDFNRSENRQSLAGLNRAASKENKLRPYPGPHLPETKAGFSRALPDGKFVKQGCVVMADSLLMRRVHV
jgi:hypothetical protein